jgi:hypothetical protein
MICDCNQLSCGLCRTKIPMSGKFIVKFVNQVRHVTGCKKHGDHVGDWEDSCIGHDNLDHAVTCQDLMSAALDGTATSSPLVSPGAMEFMNAMGELGRLVDTRTEFRIVKRWTMEEILDHA